MSHATTCPDWMTLAELRDERPESWEEALEHLEHCQECFDDALAVEPTLMFRSMPRIEVEADEVAAMKRTVAAMCRSEEIQHPPQQRQTRRQWLKAASLAAALLVAAQVPSLMAPAGNTVDPVETHAAAPVALAPAVVPAAAPAASPLPISDMAPLVEDVDPSYGAVVQVVDQEISLVLVLPPTQDV